MESGILGIILDFYLPHYFSNFLLGQNLRASQVKSKLPIVHGGQGEPKERGRPLQINKQGTYIEACLG